MIARLGAAPTAAEVSVNATVAQRKRRWRPRRSVSHPVRGRLIALATKRGQHLRDLVHRGGQTARMWSSATLAIVTSRITRKVAIIVEMATIAWWTRGLIAAR
jgi:hypothetical protein